MKITKEEVLYVAHLARLEIQDSELIDKFSSQIGNILDYINLLSNIDTSGIEATFHAVSLENILRPDDCKEDNANNQANQANNKDKIKELALLNAPQKDENFFIVPKVF